MACKFLICLYFFWVVYFLCVIKKTELRCSKIEEMPYNGIFSYWYKWYTGKSFIQYYTPYTVHIIIRVYGIPAYGISLYQYIQVRVIDIIPVYRYKRYVIGNPKLSSCHCLLYVDVLYDPVEEDGAGPDHPPRLELQAGHQLGYTRHRGSKNT